MTQNLVLSAKVLILGFGTDDTVGAWRLPCSMRRGLRDVQLGFSLCFTDLLSDVRLAQNVIGSFHLQEG